MDKAGSALSDIELNALLTYCQRLDATILEIPFYNVANPVLQECKASDVSPKSIFCSAKGPGNAGFPQGVKLAGLTKHGMAQPAP